MEHKLTTLSTSVRLDATEISALRQALDEAGIQQAYLFGSRTDPNRRGGDIDLLIFSDQDPFLLSHRVATSFFSYCEEKIDVVVMNPEALTNEQKAFLNTIEKVPFP